MLNCPAFTPGNFKGFVESTSVATCVGVVVESGQTIHVSGAPLEHSGLTGKASFAGQCCTLINES